MNILFISRAYPPVKGGIEKQNYEISQALAETCNINLIANRKGKRFLPIFLPYAIIKALTIIRKNDVVLLGDGVLAIAGFILKLVSRKPVICIIHGLDLVYRNNLYQKIWVKFFLPKMDRLIAVGNETIQQGKLRGIPESKLFFIPNGVEVIKTLPEYSRNDLESFLGRDIQGSVLLTLGRLVKRKGVDWFIENVVRQLQEDIIYIVAGEGREAATIQAAIQKHSLENRVFCIGRVSDSEKELLYCSADIFIQPNVETAGDIEGFGLVVLEAAMHGLVVIASGIEGLKDAIQDGKNGFLVPASDASAFRHKIEAVLADTAKRTVFGERSRHYVIKHYAWALVARKYLDLISST